MVKKIIHYALLSIGIPYSVGLFILNSLAYKKGGLNHHLLYRKNQYMRGIFSPLSIQIFSIVFLLIIFLILYRARKKFNSRFKSAEAMSLFYSVAFIVCSHFDGIKQLIICPYILFGILFCFLMSLIASLMQRGHEKEK